MNVELIPDSAPFSPAQRAWLNGFFSALVGLEERSDGAAAEASADEDAPWHDPALDLDERMALAEGRPLADRLMAAMGQLDCGQCGYLCASYARALAEGSEADPARCGPGGRPTTRRLRSLLGEAPLRPAAVATPREPSHVPARLRRCVPLCDPRSDKDVRHVEIDLDGLPIEYEAGDSLGVKPRNAPDVVGGILERLSASGEEVVATAEGERSLREALETVCDVAHPSDEALALLAGSATDPDEAAALARLADSEVDDSLDLVDLLDRFSSARPDAAELAGALGRLQPRLYSIASSPKAHPREVHLTVGVVRWECRGRRRGGVASTFLADRTRGGDPIEVHVHRSDGFRLPSDPGARVVMIGPGTGVAPFRAFLHERRALGHPGPNWLFFGNPHRDRDFLYRDELQGFVDDGLLDRLELAFSRDQPEKIYVQHRIRACGRPLWEWLDEGAHVYVCGDASRMAGDVHAALRDVIREHGGLGDESAEAWLARAKRDGRYLRDVY